MKIFKDFDKVSAMNIKWWERVVLLFLPTYISSDTGSDDGNVYIRFKRFNNKIYIVG